MVTLALNNTETSLETKTYDIFVGTTVVGMCQLRNHPRKSATMPEGFESNVYYEIAPAFQGKNYATEALRQLILEARKDGFTELIFVAGEDNIASQKVIERNAGILIETEANVTGRVYKKYKINI